MHNMMMGTEFRTHLLLPNWFIVCQISFTPSDRQFDLISTNQALTKRAKNRWRLLQQFTKRWRNEYLLSLRETARELHCPERQVVSVKE